MLIKSDVNLGRLVLINYLEELLDDLSFQAQTDKNLNILNNIILTARYYSNGESMPIEYLSSKEAFNFVMRSLDATQLLKNGFENTISNISTRIENYKTGSLTEDGYTDLLNFVKNFLENIIFDNISTEERVRFDW